MTTKNTKKVTEKVFVRRFLRFNEKEYLFVKTNKGYYVEDLSAPYEHRKVVKVTKDFGNRWWLTLKQKGAEELKLVCEDLQHPTKPYSHYEFRSYTNDWNNVYVRYYDGIDNSDCNASLEYRMTERYMSIQEARIFYKECVQAGFYNRWK